MTIDELKSSISVLEVARGFGLQKEREMGDIIQGTFRGERTPAFTVYLSSNSWFDFAAGDGGSNIDLVQYMNNCDLKSAIEYLERLTGEKVLNRKGNVESIANRIRRQREAYEFEKLEVDDKIFNKRIESSSIYAFVKNNANELTEEAMNYLHGRGLDDNDIKHYGFFMLNDPEHMRDLLLDNFPLLDLKNSGLIKLYPDSRKIGGKYNFNFSFAFNSKTQIIIPYYSSDGKTVSDLQARELHPKEGVNKYPRMWGRKTPWTYFIDNSTTLYLTEGVFDAIHALKYFNRDYKYGGGFLSDIFTLDKEQHNNVSSVMSCTDVGQLKKFAIHLYKRIKEDGDYYGIKEVVVIPDHDEAGDKAVKEIKQECKDINIYDYPDQRGAGIKDFNDYICQLQK